MSKKTGSLSINSENIFPIIKKWLYSDHDIFYRELVSNGCDAITKLKKLEMMGEYEAPSDYSAKLTIVVNPEKKSITIEDNGLGMDADEIDEYINQIAFSGATDFLEKYKDKANEDQIIGHFGLGFYSAFMVANEVHIDSLSYKNGATPVHWECDGGTEFSLEEGKKDSVGTTITLFLNEDCLEFANEYRAREVLEKYCSFMPYPIFLEKFGTEDEYETIDKEDVLDTDTVIEEIHEDAQYEEKEGEDGKKEMVETSPAKDKLKILKRPVPINETMPLWAKTPSECTDDEYKDFYRKVFNDFKEPLFWIHLNMDYPFNLKGILYFPKINMEYESIEGTIKLYNNQVFIADNIKEVIPDFMMLLKGAIDCPDLPLNVSRSALQNDGFVTKISDYITKKIADKLSGLCKTDRENYEKYWDDISPFIKFGCLKDEKFCDRMNDYIIFKDLDDKYTTLPDLLVKKEDSKEESSEDKKADGDEEKDNREVIYYVSDKNKQSQYIKAFKDQGLNAVILDNPIDTNFITQLESRNEDYKFERIDAGLNDNLVEESKEDLKETTESLSKTFQTALGNENLKVEVKKLKDASISSMITLSETNRRMTEMMRMYAMPGMDMGTMFGRDETLVLNANNELVQFILNNSDSEYINDFCNQLYDLALMANEPLSPEKMDAFIKRSNKIMMVCSEK